MSSIFRNSSTRSSMAAKFALINTREMFASLVLLLSVHYASLDFFRLACNFFIHVYFSLRCKDLCFDFFFAYFSLRLKFIICNSQHLIITFFH